MGVCVREREREREEQVYRKYKHHHCVCHTTLFPSRAWTDGKTNDIINLNSLYNYFEACDYGKGRYISDACLWCSANHNALSAGQSEQTVLVRRRGFVENDAFERGGA